jgi:hypothetical protein
MLGCSSFYTVPTIVPCIVGPERKTTNTVAYLNLSVTRHEPQTNEKKPYAVPAMNISTVLALARDARAVTNKIVARAITVIRAFSPLSALHIMTGTSKNATTTIDKIARAIVAITPAGNMYTKGSLESEMFGA